MCTARKPEIGNLRGLGNGLRKRSGYCKSDNFGASVGFPPFRRPWKLEIQEIQGGFGNGHRKRSGYCKVDNFGAFVGFPPFRRSWKHEIQEIQGALEMATGKGAGIAKSTILVLLWSSPHFGGLRSQKSRKSKGPWKWPLEKGIAKSTISVLLRCSPHFGGLAWKPEIQGIQGALEMAFGKGAGIAKSAILVLLWCSVHLGGLGSRKSKIYKGPWKWPPEKERVMQNRQFWCFCCVPLISAALEAGNPLEVATGKGAGVAKSTILVLLWSFPHFGGLRSRKSRESKRPWKWPLEKERV